MCIRVNVSVWCFVCYCFCCCCRLFSTVVYTLNSSLCDYDKLFIEKRLSFSFSVSLFRDVVVVWLLNNGFTIGVAIVLLPSCFGFQRFITVDLSPSIALKSHFTIACSNRWVWVCICCLIHHSIDVFVFCQH